MRVDLVLWKVEAEAGGDLELGVGHRFKSVGGGEEPGAGARAASGAYDSHVIGGESLEEHVELGLSRECRQSFLRVALHWGRGLELEELRKQLRIDRVASVMEKGGGGGGAGEEDLEGLDAEGSEEGRRELLPARQQGCVLEVASTGEAHAAFAERLPEEGSGGGVEGRKAEPDGGKVEGGFVESVGGGIGETNGTRGEGGISRGGDAPEGLCDVVLEASILETDDPGSEVGTALDEVLLLRGGGGKEGGRGWGGVRGNRDGGGGVMEDNGARSKGDELPVGQTRGVGGVEPDGGFGRVKVETNRGEVAGHKGEGCGNLLFVASDVDVIHIGKETGAGVAASKLGKRGVEWGVEGEGEGERGHGAAHRDTALGMERKLFVIIQRTGVHRAGGSPGGEPRGKVGMVGSGRRENGLGKKVREGRADVERNEGFVRVEVKREKEGFVKLFSSGLAANSILVGLQCGGHQGCEDAGRSGGGKTPEDGAAGDGADAAVGFEERDEARRGQSSKDCVGHGALGETSKGSGEQSEGFSVMPEHGIVLVAVAAGAGSAATGCALEEGSDSGADRFHVVGGGRRCRTGDRGTRGVREE